MVLAGSAIAAASPEAATIERLRSALLQQPANAALHFALAVRLARAGQVDEALAALEQAAAHGQGLLPLTDEHFAGLRTNPRYQALYRQLERRLPRCGVSARTQVLASALRFPEGIAFDPMGGQMLVGSALDGSVHAFDRQGVHSLWAAGDGRGVLGLAVHAASQLLFAVRPGGDATAPNAVIVHDLVSRQRLHVLEVREAGQLNDVAALDDGSLLVSDSQLGTLWRVPLDASTPAQIAPAGSLPAVNGLVVDVARQRVYAAHGRGIASWDMRTAQWTVSLPSRSRELLAAIDGLQLHLGDLLAVQNITHPGRVLRIQLNDAGTEVLRVQTLLSHHHASMKEPTTLAQGAGAWWVLANTSLSRLSSGLAQQSKAALPRPVLVQVPETAQAGCA